MNDLTPNFRKFTTTFGAVVTILVLSSACSSKQVLNEVAMPEPVEYNDSSDASSAYVDQTELPVYQPEPEPTPKPVHKKKVSKKSRVKKARQARTRKIERIEEESARPVIGSIDNGNFPDDGALKAAAVTVGAPTPPPVPELPLPESIDSSIDQPLLVSDIVFNWYFLVGGLLLGLAGWYTFARRKTKRALVFN